MSENSEEPKNESPSAIFAKLKGSSLIRFGSLYAMGGWVTLQVADIAFDAFGAPDWAMRTLLILLLVGFLVLVTSLALTGRVTGGEKLTGASPAVVSAALVVLALFSLGLYLNNSVPGTPLPSSAAAKAEHAAGPVIAVLPFNNLSSDAENEYLVDGLTEDIITLLAQSSGVEVIARNSTFKYKNTSPDIREVGRDLGADYVVEGSLRPMNERIRITVQVIDSRTGAHTWAKQFDRPVSEFFDVQDDVTLGIAAAVGDAVFREEFSRISQSRTDDLDAWALTSRADVAFNYEFVSEESVKLARQAIELDQNYALAHAVLGRSLVVRGLFGGGSLADIDDGEAAVRHALGLAPNDPRVLGILSITLLWSGKPAEALRRARQAVARSPSYAEGLGYLGDILIHNAKSEEAIAYIDKAIRLTPESSQRNFYLITKGEGFIHHGNFAAAEEVLKSAEFIDALPIKYLAGAQLMQGKTDEARESMRQAIDINPNVNIQKDAEIMAYYSIDEGGPIFAEIWAGLAALEAELSKKQSP